MARGDVELAGEIGIEMVTLSSFARTGAIGGLLSIRPGKCYSCLQLNQFGELFNTLHRMLLDFPFPPRPRRNPRGRARHALAAHAAAPFALDHINLWLLEDSGTASRPGPSSTPATARQRARPLGSDPSPWLDAPVTRIIVTHFHPDHLGLGSGWRRNTMRRSG